MLHCTIHLMYCIVVLIIGRALVLKEDGNEYFKQKKYKEAVMTYSEGLKQNSSDSNLNAILYCNRSAAHYHLSENISYLRPSIPVNQSIHFRLII